jgi:hypothetical protein
MASHTPASQAHPVASPRKIALVVGGLTALLAVLMLAFALPATRTGAHGVPLGVVGPPALVTQVEQQVDGFDVTGYADAGSARVAILDRNIYGALVLNDDGSVDVLVATAASSSAATAVEQVGTGVAEASGATSTVTDLRAFPDDDPRGAGLAAGALPMALGGWIGAIVIMMLIHTPGRRVAAGLAFAVVGGLGLTATLQFVVGTLDGNYLLTSLGAMLGIAATAMAVLGLRTLLGVAGLGVAAVLLILLGNPLSGLASAPELLPTPWGAIGQLLPPGATGSLIRSLAFFDGNGSLQPLLVLVSWLVGGAVLFGVAVRRERSRPDVEMSERRIEEAFGEEPVRT